MTQSAFVGPLVSLGGMPGGPRGSAPAEYSNEIGPSIFWQGAALLAMTGGGSKDKTGQGTIPALFMSTQIMALNQVIQPGGVAILTPVHAVAGVPHPLVTAFAQGISPQTPSSGAGNPIGVAIETGFAIGGATAASPTITVSPNDKWRFFPGQLVSLGGAGAGGAMFFTQVVAVPPPGTNTITVSPAPLTTNANCPIGQYHGDPGKVGFGVGGLPVSYSPLTNGGVGRFYMPASGCARGVGMSGVAAGSGGQFLITGLDIWNRLTSEIINVPAGSTAVYGLKTYSMILSAVPQFTDPHNYNLFTSDLIGVPISVLPGAPAPALLVGGAAFTGSMIQYADLTNPATTSTSDPRGAIQLTAKGPLAATGTFAAAASVSIVLTPDPMQVLNANQFNPATLFGVYPV